VLDAESSVWLSLGEAEVDDKWMAGEAVVASGTFPAFVEVSDSVT
jgi:hypothetical protein